MVGALSVVGSSVMDSHAGPPYMCLDVLSTSSVSLKLGGELSSQKRKHMARSGSLKSSFTGSWKGTKLSSGIVIRTARKMIKDRRFVIVDELGGQYDDTFKDVKTQLLNYFTYKATRTVMNQLYEMNPPQYRWLYNFVAANKPTEGKRFIRSLAKEKQDLAERVMITRLHLYGKWIKKCDHGEIYKEISDENLELMRERLMETVIWPSDDSNTEKIG